MANKPKHNRQSIIALDEFAHIREALTLGAEAGMAKGQSFDRASVCKI